MGSAFSRPQLSRLFFGGGGYCKENVHTNTPQSVPELQRSVEDFAPNIPRATSEWVIANFKRRITGASTEMEIILSIVSLPYVARKCKCNSQLFISFCR